MCMCVNDTGALRDSRGAAEAGVGRPGLQRGGAEEREPRRARHLHPGNSTGKRGSLVRIDNCNYYLFMIFSKQRFNI